MPYSHHVEDLPHCLAEEHTSMTKGEDENRRRLHLCFLLPKAGCWKKKEKEELLGEYKAYKHQPNLMVSLSAHSPRMI